VLGEVAYKLLQEASSVGFPNHAYPIEHKLKTIA
jgi:hypothetical protein